jgi:hypothetical protein
MPCACERCLEHAKTLGLAQRPSSRATLRKAFKAAAKLWHPDRHEKDAEQRREAEERFKQIQIAYRELSEHLANPVDWLVEDAFAPAQAAEMPTITFHDAPGCFAAPDFSLHAQGIIARHVREPDSAVAIVDLSGHGSAAGDLSRYILFTTQGIFVRDALGMVLLLWYSDLGEVRIVDLRRNGKLGLWHRMIERLSGTEQKYALHIHRSDGTPFFSIANETDDRVKKVIYNFLQQKRPQAHL